MPVADAIIFVLLDHEVIVDITLGTVLERSQNSAAIVLASLGAYKPLRINVHGGAPVGFRAFNDFDAEAFSLADFFEWNNYGTQG